MRRGFAVLALGLCLLSASPGRAGEKPEQVPPPRPVGPAPEAPVPVAPAAAPLAAPGAHCAAPGGGCCGGYGGTCWQRLIGWFTYHALPVPHCCKQCPCGCCRGSCYCFLPPYVYFLGEKCHEGHYYGSPCCCGPTTAPYPGVIPPPSPYPGSLAHAGPLPVPPTVLGHQ
jgi:hypothetical protein